MRMRHRCQDFLSMGVPTVWILDPQVRSAYVLTMEGIEEHTTGQLLVPGISIELDVSATFSVLDSVD